MTYARGERVAITGIGLLTANGADADENWRNLVAGRSGIAPIERFEAAGLNTRFAGCVPRICDDEVVGVDRHVLYSVHVAEEAIAQSRLPRPHGFPGPLFIAVPAVEHHWDTMFALAERHAPGPEGLFAQPRAFASYDPAMLYRPRLDGEIALRVNDQLGCRGVPLTTFTACASGATALQFAVEAVRRGDTDAALVIGCDTSLSPEMVTRFSLLSALSQRNDDPQGASRPFSRDRDGFVIAEGAAAMVVESMASARARHAQVLAVVSGFGEAADTFHRTRSSPDGSSIIACMRRAMEDAVLGIDDIDHINCHGTSTPENDKMEGMGIGALFGARAATLPISSNKSMIGHTLTAAGAVEAAVSVLTLAHGVITPTINYRSPDPTLPFDVVPNTARAVRTRHILSNSFGFGGQNVSAVLSAESTL
jgi:3-oxoacyl-[acyl-carrier-protein] synthase II